MRRLFARTGFFGMLFVLGLFLTVEPGFAEGPERERKPALRSQATQPGRIDAADLEEFFEETIARQLESYHVPGAVVAVVQDGELLFTKGYGFANLEAQTPFDPETSLVRIASISKLFTWTAVMQLVEQGKLDLNADVNEYLTAFRIPDTYPEPVTLVHLMTHSAGFEERTLGLGALREEEVPPLEAFLAAHMPARIRPPGVVSAYSNHSAALAGYIVSEVSGVPYEQYIQENILDPLEMTHSTAWEPVPDALRANLAASYDYDENGYKEVPFTYDILVPDGSISASATDMAHFMLAHLQNGRYGAARILDESTAQEMHTQSFTHHPEMSGWAHGFQERTINGQHIIMHDGNWEGFQSALMLLPDQNLGLFISYNSVGGFEALFEMLTPFFDRYFPSDDSAEPPALFEQSVEPFIGWYKPARSSMTTIERVVMLLDSSRLSALEDGTLQFRGRKWTSVAPRLYQEVDGTELLAFLPDEGTSRYAAIARTSYERIPFDQTILFNLGVLGVWAVLALSALIGWPVAALIGRRRQGGQAAPSRGARAARWAAALGSVLGLVFLVRFAFILLGDTSQYLFGVPLELRLLMVLPLVMAALTVVAVVMAVVAWKDSYWGVWGRVHYTAVVLGMVACVWFLATWNLLGFRFG